MSKGLNRVMIIGNLGKDPEVRFTPAGDAVATFSVAVNESYKNREGAKVETTEWFNVVVWRRLAEIARDYLKKGSHVFIEGKKVTRTWDKDDGSKGYRDELVANNLTMLDKGTGNAPPPHSDNDAPSSPAIRRDPNEITDDDIPF